MRSARTTKGIDPITLRVTDVGSASIRAVDAVRLDTLTVLVIVVTLVRSTRLKKVLGQFWTCRKMKGVSVTVLCLEIMAVPCVSIQRTIPS